MFYEHKLLQKVHLPFCCWAKTLLAFLSRLNFIFIKQGDGKGIISNLFGRKDLSRSQLLELEQNFPLALSPFCMPANYVAKTRPLSI